MKIIFTDFNSKIDINVTSEELIQMVAAGINLGCLFSTGESSSEKEEDNNPVKAEDLLKQEEIKILCHTSCDIGFGSEKAGMVIAWLDQHNIHYEKCSGVYAKYIKYELTASQLKEMTDLLIKHEHLDRGVFI